MSESASVEVLSAEVRVIEVGDRHLTHSMYRQLDEATFERFKPCGRVKDIEPDHNERVPQLVGRDTETGALVRYYPRPPDWSRRIDGTSRDGPSEFAHWLLHTEQSTPDWPYPVADGPNGHRLLWTGHANPYCANPPRVVVVYPGEESSELPKKPTARIGQVLRRILLAFSYSPPLEANNGTRIERGFSQSQRLEANEETRCTVDLVELERVWRARAEAEVSELIQAQAEYDRLKRLPLIVLPD
jgi:hypothetical protein